MDDLSELGVLIKTLNLAVERLSDHNMRLLFAGKEDDGGMQLAASIIEYKLALVGALDESKVIEARAQADKIRNDLSNGSEKIS